MLKRLAIIRQTSFADLQCSVHGTSIRKSQSQRSIFGFRPSLVYFRVKLTLGPNREWYLYCTMYDVQKLHLTLQNNVQDPIFQSELAGLVCPRRPLFRRKNALVIKTMCCDLDHYLNNLLAITQTFSTTSTNATATALVESAMRQFFEQRPSKSTSSKSIKKS